MKVIFELKELQNKENLPSIHQMINFPIAEKDLVIDYMKNAMILAAAPAIVKDVFDPNIRIPELLLMGDGKYQWRSDIVYYIDKYNLKIPDEFLKHILSQIQ